MKRIFIGGERPHEAVDITATLELKVSGSTLENVANAANDMWVADEKDLIKVLKYAPTAQEIRNGKVEEGLILPVYRPAEGIADMVRNLPDVMMSNPMAYEPTVVAVPVERLRASGDLKQMADADAKCSEWLYFGHTVVDMCTNLKLEYIVNRMQSITGFKYCRIVVLKDKPASIEEVAENYNGKLILPPLHARISQAKHKRALRSMLFMSNIKDAKDPEDPEWNAVIDRFNALRKEVRIEIIAL